MNSTLDCSICIANYNGRDYIDACIASITEQIGGVTFEIIVHDDASIDGSADYIREKYPSITLIESKKNVGFCVSNNRMVAASSGKYLLLLNNDAMLFSDALNSLMEASETAEVPTLLGLPQYDAGTHQLIDRGSLFDLFLNPMPNVNPHIEDVGMISGACFWISRKIWDEFGGFPEWFHTLAEDLYICCCAHLAGYPVRVVNNSGFYHWIGRSLGGGKVVREGLSTTVIRRSRSEVNKTYVMAITYPVFFLCIVFTAHITLLMAEGFLLSFFTGRWDLFRRIYLRVPMDVLKNRSLILSSRKQHISKHGSVSLLSKLSIVPYKFRMALKYGIPEIQ